MGNTEVILSIKNPCDYNCFYCVGSKDRATYIKTDLKKISEFYDKIEGFIVTSMECGAGEPTLHSQIKDILEIAVSKGAVSIPTNNSLSPKKWMPSNPGRVLMRAAFHPSSEQDIDGYTDRILQAKDMGANVSIIFVLHPMRLEKGKMYQEFFKKYEIKFTFMGFEGEFEGKKYPLSHSKEEQELIGSTSSYWLHRLSFDMTTRDFQGIPCMAGCASVYITPEGFIRRCLYDKNKMEKLNSESLPCTVQKCGCGLHLVELNTYDSSFWNYWRALAKMELIPNTDSMNEDQLYQVKREKYFELMKKYGKL